MDNAGWRKLLGMAAAQAGLAVIDLPADVRTTRLGDVLFAMNFSASTVRYTPPHAGRCLLGAEELAPQQVSVWHAPRPFQSP